MATLLTSPLKGNPQAAAAAARRCSRTRTTRAAASRKSRRGVGLISSERAPVVRLPRGQASALSSRGPTPPAALPPLFDQAPALFQSVLVRGECDLRVVCPNSIAPLRSPPSSDDMIWIITRVDFAVVVGSLAIVAEPRAGPRPRRQHRRVRARHQGAAQGPHLAGRHQLLVPRHGAWIGSRRTPRA